MFLVGNLQSFARGDCPMNPPASKTTTIASTISQRTAELFKEQQQNIVEHTDRIFARLMACQWVFGILLALWISPRTWNGTESQVHLHVWAAVFLGGLVTGVPVLLGLLQPGRVLTRHVIAIGQMLMSALLIHLTGG
ncbi:MAG: integral rane sensor hybrid histidine kinase, partial [Pedosphaera sp.]|nr:integral rane sensor hybrid histidine kinase [Pedosphaera sp.]